MNIHRAVQPSPFFYHPVMETSLKQNYVIAAIALAAIGLIALMATYYRKRLEKNHTQPSQPNLQREHITLNAVQPIVKSNALFSSAIAVKGNPKALSVSAYSSPQGSSTPLILNDSSDEEDEEDYSDDEIPSDTYDDKISHSPAFQQDSEQVVQLKNLLKELRSFTDYENSKTPIRNNLRSMGNNLMDMYRRETNIEGAVANTGYRISELSAWQADHNYTIKPDLSNILMSEFLDIDIEGTDTPAPQLLDLIPPEIAEAYDFDQLEAMVNAAIEHDTKIKESNTQSLTEQRVKINDYRNEIRTAENEERIECFAFMHSLSNQYGKLLTGITVEAQTSYPVQDIIRWNPSSNKFFISHQSPFEEKPTWEAIDSPEDLEDNINDEDFQIDSGIIYYKISQSVLDGLMLAFYRKAEERIFTIMRIRGL